MNGTALAHAGEALGAQIALLSPLVAAPLALALWTAARSRDPESPSRFLLWLTGVPLLLFSAMPFLGERAIPHWYNSAWLFAFPLLGAWLSQKSAGWLRSWAIASAVLTALSFAVFTSYVAAGPFWRAADAKASRSSTEWSYGWRGLEGSPAWSAPGATPPAFAVVENWRTGGKAGGALGPEVPVCAFTQDPRGFAFECDAGTLLGQDALIVIPKENGASTLAVLAPYFERLGPTYEIGEGRGGRVERYVTVTRGYKLLRAYETPYGINAKAARGG